MEQDSTARSFAKWCVRALVSMKTAETVAHAADDYTGFDKDDFIVKFGAGAVGWIVGAKLQPVTDTMVDKTFDFVIEKRNNHRDKKTTEKKD